MSRYYKIVVSGNPQTGAAGFSLTNRFDGKCLTSYQNIELDIWQYGWQDPVSNGSLKIWGPTKQQISQSSDYINSKVEIWAGMQDGLPLASASSPYSGQIYSGYAFQSFGNWQGTNQTLDFVLAPELGGTQSDPANISFSLPKGQPLSDAIKYVLKTASPTLDEPIININPNLALGADEAFTYDTLTQFASYVNGLSKDIVGGNYQGVTITKTGNRYVVFDGTQQNGPVTLIKAQDMVGQVTWLSAFSITFVTVMRNDLTPGSSVQFQPISGLTAVTNVNSASQVRSANTFNGTWQITSVRHVGNARDQQAQSWVTVFQAINPVSDPAVTSVGNSSS